MADVKYKPVLHDHEAFLKKALKRKGFRIAYDDLKEEYTLTHEMLGARSRFGLTQEAVAELMGTTKSAVSRLESAGKHVPSLTTLKKYAQAVGCRLEIKLVPNSRLSKGSARTAKSRRPVSSASGGRQTIEERRQNQKCRPGTDDSPDMRNPANE